MPFCGVGGKTTQRKLVLLGDGACGKTSLLNVFTRGFFPTVYEPTVFENYVHDIFVDGIQMELSLWDTAGQEEFDRLRSLSYDDTQAIMLCFSVRIPIPPPYPLPFPQLGFLSPPDSPTYLEETQVDNRPSLENVSTKWLAEINEHCPGVKIVLCALKCDLREEHEKEEPEGQALISYAEGLEAAKRIGALRYLGEFAYLRFGAEDGNGGCGESVLTFVCTVECSAMRNRGVSEAFTEAARVALAVKPAKAKEGGKCVVM
ncbi:Rho GTPase [Knufia obscura]|uniref:Rho GTPase n=1 Tax=Knufia obscura TaxID=1635080 RepID=A0ABR0RC52_9EURO|nr:Rho GTPase [Knufia obscura]